MILPVLFILLSAWPAAAANHYIRDGATGSAPCSDWSSSNACDSLPASLIRGDTYYVADGTYGSHTFSDAVQGNTVITIKKATLADHGTASGWSDVYGSGTANWGSWMFLASYYNIDGMTGGGPGSWTSGHGFRWTQSAGTAVHFIAIGTAQSTLSNINIRHAKFDEQGNTVMAVGAMAVYAPGTLTNSTFDYNYFTNLWGLPFLFRFGSGLVVQHNYSDSICNESAYDATLHCEAIVFWGLNDSHFRWNFHTACPSSGCYVHNNIYSSDAVRIYGNVFGGPAGAVLCNSGPCTNWRVFNNTVHHNLYAGIVAGDGTLDGSNLVYNNIAINGFAGSFNSFGLSHDYNWYTQETPSCTMRASVNENICVGCNAGCDAISTTFDPFVNSSGSMPEDFHLTTVASMWQGINICLLDTCTGNNQYHIDAFGRPRGADGTWDRGAFEFVASSPSSHAISGSVALSGGVVMQ